MLFVQIGRWISRQLNRIGSREKCASASDDFVSLMVDHLEDRRVLSVTAVLADGVLSVTGEDGVEDSVEVLLSNSTVIDEEFIQLLDGDGDVIPIQISNGREASRIATSSLFSPNTMQTGRLDIQLGTGPDNVRLQVPTGASFLDEGFGPLEVNVGGDDDFVTVADNEDDPVAENVVVNIAAETIQFADEEIQFETVDLNLSGTIELPTDQSLITEGDVQINGKIVAVDSPDTDFDIQAETLSVNGSIDLNGDLFISSESGVTLDLSDEANIIDGRLEIDAGSSVLAAGNFLVGEDIVIEASDSITFGEDALVENSGRVNLFAVEDVFMLEGAKIESSGDRFLIVAGDALDSTTSDGGVNMGVNTSITALNARVDMVAVGDLTIGNIETNQIIRLETFFGGVSSNGTDGVNVRAKELGINSSEGVGVYSVFRTSVEELAVANSNTGDIRIENTGRSNLTIGTSNNPSLDDSVDPTVGIKQFGDFPSDIEISNEGSMTVEESVINDSGGDVTLRAVDGASTPGDLNVFSTVIATESGAVSFEAANELNLFDTGEMIDVRGGSVTGMAGMSVNFTENVIVQSSTGAITDPVPLLMDVETPQVLSSGIAKILGEFGRVNDNTFVFQILWDPEGPVEDILVSGDPIFSDEFQQIVGVTPGIGPGSFLFDHFYSANPNEISPSSPIPITITLFDDPNILFTEAGVELGRVSATSLAPVPGEGLAGGIPFDLSIEAPELIPPRVVVTESYQAEAANAEVIDSSSVLESVVDFESVQNERLLIIQKVDADGNVIVDRFGRPVQETLSGEEAQAVLNNLPELFDRLRDGRWKIFIQEGVEGPKQLVDEFDLRNGRPAGDVDEGLRDRPPTQINQPVEMGPNSADDPDVQLLAPKTKS